jgi:peptidoglycan/LPS O-acetylase OafA/YrhL
VYANGRRYLSTELDFQSRKPEGRINTASVSRMVISDVYAKGRPNALNGLRLLLAAGVLLWHSFALTGATFNWGDPAAQLLGQVFVDGFFAVSGFLIATSWIRTPRVRAFLVARALRIFPAFWVCLLLTAFLFAPLSVVLAGGSDPWAVFSSAGPYFYVLGNAGLIIFQRGIEGTLTSVAYPEAWNGSLWTLSWEFLCYLGVVVLGYCKVLENRLVLWGIFGLILTATVFELVVESDSITIASVLRFGITFMAGVVVAAYRDRIPVRASLIVLSIAVVVFASWAPSYRLIAALPLAYALIALGGAISHPKLQFKNDISYGLYIYGFPVQQLIASSALDMNVFVFWLLSAGGATVFAIGSWFIVEKPALRLKSKLTARPRRASNDYRAETVAVGEDGGRSSS